MLDKTVKIKTHLILPEALLRAVDKIAGKRKRSYFIAEATEEKLEREKFLRTLEETSGAWSDEKHADLKTKEDIDRYLRKMRVSYNKRLERLGLL